MEHKKEFDAALGMKLENGLEKRIEFVECYKEAYGGGNEYSRFDCNYIDKNHQNIGVKSIDENKLAVPFWIFGLRHNLLAINYVKGNGARPPTLSFQYDVLSGEIRDEILAPDAIVQENIVDAILRNKD